MGALTKLRDGLSNIMTGGGTTADRRAHGFWHLRIITPEQIEAAYRSSWLMRKVVDLPAEDMTRAGRDWQADADQITALEAEEDRLNLWPKLLLAVTYARLGGGAIIMGLPGDLGLPVNAGALKSEGSLRYIHVVTRWELTIGEEDRDPESEWFGQPKNYTLSTKTGRQLPIHPSRVVPFRGLKVPALRVASWEDRFWGDSIIQNVDEAVKNADLAQGGFASLIEEAKIDVIKVPGLMANVASAEYEQRFMRRLEIAQMGKSTHRAFVIDGEEDWQQKQLTWAGIPEIVRTYLSIVAGAADIPATRLLGKSPDGQNATGDSDLTNYYDMIANKQGTDLKPCLDRIDAALIPSALGSLPDEVHFIFAPLKTMSDKEQAEVENKEADTVSKYANSGLVPESALAKATQNRMIESGRWPGLEQAIEDAEAAGEELPDDDDPSALTQTTNGGKEGDPTSPTERGAGPGSAPARAANDSRVMTAADLGL